MNDILLHFSFTILTSEDIMQDGPAVIQLETDVVSNVPLIPSAQSGIP